MSHGIRLQTVFSGCLRRSLCVLIKNCAIKNLKNELKEQLSKKSSRLLVDQMIGYLNIILINSFKHYNISFTAVRQFFPLNNLLHKLFYKYLLRKYSSLPKIYSYIETHFKNQGKLMANNKFLLRITGINSLSFATSYSAPFK